MSTERWEILRTLGSGGFGTVYLAEYQGESDFSKRVALKVLNDEVSGSAEIARRLRDEARVLGLVRHRAIVQVDRLTRIDDKWTVVMEYVEGCDLSAAIADRPIPPRPALEIVAETAAALHSAWVQRGPDGAPLHLLHRDIKPSNIQLTPAGEVKILDFGVARADFDLREAQTRSMMFGSLPYMSPERLDFRDEPGGDIYALGVCLLEALTGEGLGKTSARADRHQPLLDAADAAMVRGLVPAEVRGLVRHMLAYEPEDRPEAREVERQAIALAEQIGGERLRDWAERAVPRAAARRGAVPAAPLTGSLVIADADAAGVIAEPSTARRTGPVLAVVGGLAGVGLLAGVAVVVVVVAVVGWSLIPVTPPAGPPDGPPVAPAEPVQVAPAEPAGPEPPPSEPPPVTTEPTPDEPGVSAKPTPPAVVPAPPPVDPTPPRVDPVPTRPTSPPTGRVKVSGADVVWLDGASKLEVRGSREVPAGRYTIELEVDGMRTSVGELQVPAGGVKVLTCSAAFARCSVGDR